MRNILDYDKLLHGRNIFGEIIGKQRYLKWPVKAYRVTLPKAKPNSGGINPFERVILKIIEACGIKEAEVLAKETCLPYELVKCILMRLKDKGFINDHNEIIKVKFDSLKAKEEKEFSYVTALLFQETATGKILPFLHLLDNDNPLITKDYENKKHSPKEIHYNQTAKEPGPNDVIYALRAMSKHSNYGLTPQLSAVNLINVAKEGERYYLDCPIAIQKSGGEFRIADPFGNGFSLHLEKAFSDLLEQDKILSEWLEKWKHKLENQNKNKQDERQKEPFENDVNMGRYPELIFKMRLRKNTQYRSIEQIHSAIEWALFYSCKERSYNTAVSKLGILNQERQKNLLREAVKNIGFDFPRNGFCYITEGKLDAFERGEADMWTVLSIAILTAEKDKSHPFHRIADDYQDFINMLLHIKKKRDDQGHGKSLARRDVKLSNEENFLRNVVTALLPDIRFSNTPVTVIDKDAVSDEIFEARRNIQHEIGFKKYNSLLGTLQDCLINTERFWLSCKDDNAPEYDAKPFVFDLYAALQAMFLKKLSGALPPDIEDSEFIRQARENAVNAGLGRLPNSLCKVKPQIIRKILQGINETLGACAVAFLIVSDKEDLIKIAELQPSFISCIDDIILKRGHGNELLIMDKKNIKKIRKSIYLTIKTLLEV